MRPKPPISAFSDILEMHPDKIMTDPNCGCWIWIGTLHDRGYGRFTRMGVTYTAHRVSYEMRHGAGSADGLVVRHHCDNPPCCNPDHLAAGTVQDNVDDRERRGRGRQGHLYGEDHTNSKLRKADVLNIRERLDRGEILRTIAEDFNVHFGTIHAIKTRRIWDHV